MTSKRSRRAVFLVGFMGAGKNRVGRALARQLGWGFVDLDRRVQARQGRSIARIFRESGEAAFRKAETAELKALLKEQRRSRRAVVALGGGVPAVAVNRRLLRGTLTVFLEVPVERLWERSRTDRWRRPLVTNEASFRRLYRARREHYRAATLRLPAGDRSPQELATRIAQWLGYEPGTRPQERP